MEYDLLPAPGQQMLARLSVFAAPFTTAAEAVGGQEDRDAVQDLATQARADFTEALEVARAAGDQVILGYLQLHYGARLCLDGDYSAHAVTG